MSKPWCGWQCDGLGSWRNWGAVDRYVGVRRLLSRR